jgi:hypothetical protein
MSNTSAISAARPEPTRAYAQAVTSFVPSAMPIEDPAPAIEREWIATTGIGGDSGRAIASEPARRFHGPLLALDPPLGRTVLAARLDDSVSFADNPVPLFADQSGDAQSPVEPGGFRHLTRFPLEGKRLEWSYRIDSAVLERPTGSGVMMNLAEDANDQARRHQAVPRRRRGRPTRPRLGASHQTGCTGLVATLLQDQGEEQ